MRQWDGGYIHFIFMGCIVQHIALVGNYCGRLFDVEGSTGVFFYYQGDSLIIGGCQRYGQNSGHCSSLLVGPYWFLNIIQIPPFLVSMIL